MEKKYTAPEFASIIGCAAKTVYSLIDKNELVTVNERVNGRQTKLIIADENKIQELKEVYCNSRVNYGKCKEMLQDNNGNSPSNYSNYEPVSASTYNNNNELVDRVIDFADKFTEKIELQNKELKDYINKAVNLEYQVKMIEDKANNKEAIYVKEVNDLRAENEALKKGNELSQKRKQQLIAVIVLLTLLLFTCASLLFYSIGKANNSNSFNDTLPSQTVNNGKLIETSTTVQPAQKNNPVKKATVSPAKKKKR